VCRRRLGQAKDLAELTATSRQDAFEVERLKKLLEAQEARQQAETERLQNQVASTAHAHDRAPALLFLFTSCAVRSSFAVSVSDHGAQQRSLRGQRSPLQGARCADNDTSTSMIFEYLSLASASRLLAPTAAVLSQANADAEARARRDADEGAALRRALDAEQRERAALAEHAAAYNQAERARADTEEECRRLKGEVERLGRKLAEAEESLEVQTVQAHKAREEAGTLRAENGALSHQVPSPLYFIPALLLSSPHQHFSSSP